MGTVSDPERRGLKTGEGDSNYRALLLVDGRPIVHEGHRLILDGTNWDTWSNYGSLEALVTSDPWDFQPDVILLGGIRLGQILPENQVITREQIDLLKAKFPNSKVAMITAAPEEARELNLGIPILSKEYSREGFLDFLNGLVEQTS